MTAPERTFIRIGPNGALGADRLQWIVYRRAKGQRVAFDGETWQPVSFVHSTKWVLERCLREAGIEVSASGRAALDALPETWKAWAQP